MLVNKTVEFFLSEAAGRGWRSARAGSGLGAGCRQGPRLGPGQDAGGGRGRDWDEMPVTKSPGRQRTRSGQEPDEMPAGVEAWAGTKCRRGSRPGLGQDAVGDRG